MKYLPYLGRMKHSDLCMVTAMTSSSWAAQHFQDVWSFLMRTEKGFIQVKDSIPACMDRQLDDDMVSHSLQGQKGSNS